MASADKAQRGVPGKQSPSTRRISLADAVAARLADEAAPVVTKFSLGLLIFRTFAEGGYEGRSLQHERRDPVADDVTQVRRELVDRAILMAEKELPEGVFAVRAHRHAPAEQVVCALDPFAYLSHLSAMEYYGLTNRIPVVLFITSPPSVAWKQRADKLMERELGGELDAYLGAGLPRPSRHGFRSVRGQSIKRTGGSVHGAFTHIRSQRLRVATVGRTFLDMLRRPELCGGFAHVLEVFENHAVEHLPLIINEVNQHGRKIDRVRAGWILEKRCGVRDPAIDAWQADTQRGGSQKLNPHAEFSRVYSERWSLSINEPDGGGD
jgi:hypothetical protein